MLIREVKLEDALLYKCLARNENGQSERLIKLIVLGVPEKPSQLRVRDVWSRSALVTWASPGLVSGANQQPAALGSGSSVRVTNYTVQYWRKSGGAALAPLSQLQNHRREEILVDGLQNSALLINLLPAVAYEVSVIARNQVGQSEPSEPVNVTTSEEEPSGPPTDVSVESLGSSSLRVLWKVPPSETLNGKLLGFYIGYRPRSFNSPGAGSMLGSAGSGGAQANSQPSNLQSVIYSFKTADAVENQLYYDTFLTNLKHNHEYEVTVRAFNKAGSGPDCHTILARTNSARLPPAPNLQLQRVSTSSVTLRWSSTVLLGPGRPGADVLRYALYYQPQGERDWFELSVAAGGQLDNFSGRELTESLQQQQKSALMELIGGAGSSSTGSGSGGGSSGELITSQASLHTLSNLKPGFAYRIYVAAANEYGTGDPSNVVTVRTEPLNSTSSAFLLDPNAAASPNGGLLSGSLLEAWNQQTGGLMYTSLGLVCCLLVLISLAAYFVWQRNFRSKYHSSSASSWTPAACDTIQSEYSIKRFPAAALPPPLNKKFLIQQQQPLPAPSDIYDEVVDAQRPSASQFVGRFQQSAGSGGQPMIRQSNSRPHLGSHYHPPADLMSAGSGTLQLSHLAGSRHNQQQQQQQKLSATLNRNQNRQLPPIPYSTLSVKEMNGSGQPGGRRQQPLEYRLKPSGQGHYPPGQSTGGSQTPLIYGVVE